jgi:hypothetical protein
MLADARPAAKTADRCIGRTNVVMVQADDRTPSATDRRWHHGAVTLIR